jgi:hypothetical protein
MVVEFHHLVVSAIGGEPPVALTDGHTDDGDGCVHIGSWKLHANAQRSQRGKHGGEGSRRVVIDDERTANPILDSSAERSTGRPGCGARGHSPVSVGGNALHKRDIYEAKRSREVD